MSADAIQVVILGLAVAGPAGRRLAAPVVMITMKHRTEEEALLSASDLDAPGPWKLFSGRSEVNAVSSEVMTAVQQHPRLDFLEARCVRSLGVRTLGEIGFEILPQSDVVVTSSLVECPQYESIPPGLCDPLFEMFRGRFAGAKPRRL